MESETSPVVNENKVKKYCNCFIKYTIFHWIDKTYFTSFDFAFDIIAGLSVGLTLIPLSTAYAGLAGVPVKTGLNATVAGFLMYALFGSIKQIFIGPSSVLSIITHEFTYGMNNDFVVLLTFLTGCVQFCLGIFRLGFVVHYISKPVVSGFINAATINIVAAMLPGLLGLQFDAVGFIDRSSKTIKFIKKVRYWSDVPLGVSCLFVLFILTKLQDIKIEPDTKTKTALKVIILFTSVSRNIIVILSAVGICALFEKHTHKPAPFITIGAVKPGIEVPKLPPFHTTLHNETYNFQEMIHKLISGVVMLPIMSSLFTMTIAKYYSQGKPIPYTREFIALGFCNTFGGLLGAMPQSGALISSAVAQGCNVRTPVSGLYTGMLSLLTCAFLTPYMHIIPKASLSAVLVFSVVMRFDLKTAYPLWKTDKIDFTIMCLTVIATLGHSLAVGLLSGILLSILHLIYLWGEPNITVGQSTTASGKKYIEFTPEKGMYFPAVDELSQVVLHNQDNKSPTVINCTHFSDIDFTASKELTTLSKSIELIGQKLILYNVKPNLIDKCTMLTNGKIPFLRDQKELEAYFLNINDQ